LLKLRKVEIVGFKSFCERTVVTFSGKGTTCIVGPNGCGKSNVVDAISWVLGEQSHKSLRAERMADCIFNGTTKRPPMGLAEVTITMEDPELAEAARFVLESAEENSGPNTESTEFESLPAQEGMESAEKSGNDEAAANQAAASGPGIDAWLEIQTDTFRQGGAQHAAPLLEGVGSQDEVVAEPEFVKGRRRKKAADKPVLAMKPG
jgi:chromosome segregation protein